jgi:hypothetical protein
MPLALYKVVLAPSKILRKRERAIACIIGLYVAFACRDAAIVAWGREIREVLLAK